MFHHLSDTIANWLAGWVKLGDDAITFDDGDDE